MHLLRYGKIKSYHNVTTTVLTKQGTNRDESGNKPIVVNIDKCPKRLYLRHFRMYLIYSDYLSYFTRNEGLTSALNRGIMWLVGFY